MADAHANHNSGGGGGEDAVDGAHAAAAATVSITSDAGGGGACERTGGCDRGGGGGGCSSRAADHSNTSPVKGVSTTLAYQHGHSFIKKTFHKPTNCHFCSELLWGLMGQGYICEGKYHPRL